MKWLKISLTLAALLGSSSVAGQQAHRPAGDHDVHRPGMHHDFSDAESYSTTFDNAARNDWQKPAYVVTLLEIGPGMTVADIGAGTGYFEPHLAAAVGNTGTVLALDVEPNMITHLTERIAEADLSQVEARLIPYDDPELAAASVDRVLIVNTWHHIDDRASYSARLVEALKPGGSVAVVDFTRESPFGPPVHHRLQAAEVIAEMEAGGLAASEIDEDLPHQFVVVGRR